MIAKPSERTEFQVEAARRREKSLPPVRHRPSLFSIDVGSKRLKEVQQQMEHPFWDLPT